VLVLSRAHGESVPYLRAAIERRPEQVVEMPNGVDVERFSPGPAGNDGRAEFGVPEDAVMAVFCATLDRAHHFKRLDLAIEGLRLSGESDVHLVVAGDGELRAGYERQAAEAGLAERVHFAGAVAHDRLPALLRAADFFLFPTQPPESFGIVLIEAMASGLPVIASDYPGVRAVVDDGEDGLLVPLGDADAVASAVRRMVEVGADGRRAMGAAGRAKCERTWTWPRLTDRMDEVYRAAIETRRAKRGRG
jgi:glycosyltransferase involved in cell wall biosynthesis